ncbi:aromatic ring-hydroxylating dioxygenase subunit alpha [Novosphingobium sp. ERN07]|uniref:aromatic ring-hydroxylating dioxygenase subunit alpha n=1 Tax=Novosphingobium sp. ERN07 TaxID=2726187 RepID=UPI001456A817|nr:aromatic ring-hydroxylating dioxygenase subunit alpha [Novosphingobium sp. ERN07]NLR73191.1 aromatic ring-hydroxylating dioxygenase subunit alpha [Novosphingobium sp. ERN07]
MEQLDLMPGEHRCPGASTRDIILADGQSVPPALVTESPAFLGDEDIAYDRYTSPAFFDQEIRKLWPKVWQWVCRTEDIREPGEFVTYDVGPYSLIIMRGKDARIRAFHNSCLHRGTQLRQPGEAGWTPELRCPFHGWTWTTEGALKSVPCRWDFPHVNDAAFGLPEAKVDTWGGFVFINMDENAQPLDEFLEVMPEHLDGGWDLSRRTVAVHVQKELNTNWKAAQEAFLEAYHVVETHAQNLPFAGDANAQYDVFGDHVSRFVHTHGVPSPHYPHPQTEQEIADKMHLPAGTIVPEGRTARSVAADWRRVNLGAKWDLDLSGYSDSEMLDSIEYHLFPNMCVFPGVSLPMVYRFRPIGMDPGRTLFDLLFLRPLKDGEEHPEPVEPVRLTHDQSYSEAPGLEPWLGATFDQDTDNLARQYRGFQSSRKRGETLGNYQESRIRHLHQVLDAYLAK